MSDSGEDRTMHADLLRASLMCGLRPDAPGVHQLQIFYCVWKLIGRRKTIESLQRCIETGRDRDKDWVQSSKGIYALTQIGYQKARAAFPSQTAVLSPVAPEAMKFTMEPRNFSAPAVLRISNTGGAFAFEIAGAGVSGIRAAEWMDDVTGGQLGRTGSQSTRRVFNYGIDHGWLLQWESPGVDTEFIEEGADASAPPAPEPSDGDKRRHALRKVLVRQGQPRFRRNLLEAYNGACCISGERAAGALEAAHISTYARSGTDDVGNGLLLRADIHNLFDLDLLRIDPETWHISVHQSLAETSYQALDGKELVRPENILLRPLPRYFAERYQWMGRFGSVYTSRRSRPA